MPPERIPLTLYDDSHAFQSLVTRHDVLWFVLDTAELEVAPVASLERTECAVDMTLYLRIPYRRGSQYVQVAKCSKSLTLETVETSAGLRS